jgi:membrane protein implicated in regulation of membrane protease activity
VRLKRARLPDRAGQDADAMTPFEHLWTPIFSHPLTWLAALVVAAGEAWFLQRFQPPLGMAATSFGISAVLLVLWPVMLVRSDAFVTLLYRVSEKLRRGRLVKLAQLLDQKLEHKLAGEVGADSARCNRR